jgi:hypothetical protein
MRKSKSEVFGKGTGNVVDAQIVLDEICKKL